MHSHSNSAPIGHVDRRRFIQQLTFGASGFALVAMDSAQPAVASTQEDSPAFDFENGNAAIDVLIPNVVPVIFSFVSTVASDATLVLRITTMLANAWFDAIAPYHATAVGVYSHIGRRPESESTNTNKNIAMIYASDRVLQSLLPRHAVEWQGILESVGLEPVDADHQSESAAAIGIRAGDAVVAARERDGMNQLGDEGDRAYNHRPYADYTNYQPVNTAYELVDPARWQPQLITDGNGIFRSQQAATPQIRVTRPYSYEDPDDFVSDPPSDSDPDTPGYKRQVDEVLAASAALTDYQKMVAELYDNKILGIGFSALFVSQQRGFTLDEFVQYDFLVNLAAFDSAIAVWKEKQRHDAVRPFSAIAHIYGDEPVTAWGGPGMGTVDDIPANQWRSYLATADHQEYPSGSASFCSAHAEASRLFLDSDQFGWSIPVAAGSSRIEPGLTPATDIVIGPWETWTAMEEECGLSRVWGGVHFPASVPAGQAIGKAIGRLAYAFVQSHIDGEVT